jgi:hypothetical protein
LSQCQWKFKEISKEIHGAEEMLKFNVDIGGHWSRFALKVILLVASPFLAGSTSTMHAQPAGGIASGPSCAASASGARQIICVVGGESTNELYAVWQNETPGTTAGTLNNTAITYLDLGVQGTVGNSSCASVADGTGDTVCAYNNSRTLYGIRFNVGNNTAPMEIQYISPPQNLGISNVVALNHASCAIGASRFTAAVIGVTPSAEPAEDDTICAAPTGVNGDLKAVAFNPNVTADLTAVLDLNLHSDSDPSCTNPNENFASAADPNIASNEVTCVAILSSDTGIQAVTFDPRTPSTVSTQLFYGVTALSGGTAFATGLNPACSAAWDLSGDVICVAPDEFSDLLGFAFHPGPSFSVTPMPASSPLTLNGDLAITGSPSCSGFGTPATFSNGQIVPSADANSKQILCAVRVRGSDLLNSVAFDPRPSPATTASLSPIPTTTQIFPSNPTAPSMDPSCTFQNVNADTVSCAGAGTINGTANQWFVIPAVPPSIFP